MARLVPASNIRAAQSAITKANTVSAVIEVLRGYNVLLVLGKPDEATRKANRKFKIKAVR
jgi:uncharacterized protein (DUF362 family)